MSLILYKDLVDDCTVANIPECGSVKAVGKSFIEKINPFSYDLNEMKISEGVSIPIYNGEIWQQIVNREDIDFTPASLLDVGNSFEVGCDYSVYICMDGENPEIVISKNDTFPNGSTALTSRRIGGFHYGVIRKVSDDGLWIPIDSVGNKFGASGTKWQDNVTVGIVPNSVWDLVHRPKILHPGLVEVNGFWLGSYQASAEENFTFMNDVYGLHMTSGKLATKYGALPVTGAEGLDQFVFNEAAKKQGLRLPRYTEWLAAAFGSPQGEDESNNYGWTKRRNTARTYTGCSVNTSTGKYDSANGAKPFAISAYNVHDCAGNVCEWTSDYSICGDSVNWNWQSVLGAGMGRACLPDATGLVALCCGGACSNGMYCGPRAVDGSNYPWFVRTFLGLRVACDAA